MNSNCPKCGEKLDIKLDHIVHGKVVTCTTCSAQIDFSLTDDHSQEETSEDNSLPE